LVKSVYIHQTGSFRVLWKICILTHMPIQTAANQLKWKFIRTSCWSDEISDILHEVFVLHPDLTLYGLAISLNLSIGVFEGIQWRVQGEYISFF